MAGDAAVSEVVYATATAVAGDVVESEVVPATSMGVGATSFVPSWMSAMPSRMPLHVHDLSDAANAATEALSYLHRESMDAASSMHSGVLPNPMDRLRQMTLSPSNNFDLDPMAGVKEALNKATDKFRDSSRQLAYGLFGGLLGVGVIVAAGIIVAAYMLRPPYEKMHDEFMAQYALQQHPQQRCNACGKGTDSGARNTPSAAGGGRSYGDAHASVDSNEDSAEVFGGMVTEL